MVGVLYCSTHNPRQPLFHWPMSPSPRPFCHSKWGLSPPPPSLSLSISSSPLTSSNFRFFPPSAGAHPQHAHFFFEAIYLGNFWPFLGWLACHWTALGLMDLELPPLFICLSTHSRQVTVASLEIHHLSSQELLSPQTSAISPGNFPVSVAPQSPSQRPSDFLPSSQSQNNPTLPLVTILLIFSDSIYFILGLW